MGLDFTTKRALRWAGVFLATILIFALIIGYWTHQARKVREDLYQRLESIHGGGRSAMVDIWEDKIHWEPKMDAPTALAIAPRTPANTFDTIFVVFEGEEAIASLALTRVAGFFNLKPMNQQLYPDTIIGSPLSEAEVRGLAQLVHLLAERVRKMDKRTELAEWNAHVLLIANELLELHGGEASGVTPEDTSETVAPSG